MKSGAMDVSVMNMDQPVMDAVSEMSIWDMNPDAS
jgi:hypothetical protein